MKAKSIILILFLSFIVQCELFSINPGIRIIRPGIHFEYALNNYQKSFNLGLDQLMYNNNLKSNRFFYQLDILNYNIIEYDKYNNNTISKSYLLSGFNLFWLIATTGLPQLLNENEELTIMSFDYLKSLPILLTNSTSYYDFYNIKTGEQSYFASGIFLKTKLDYFSNENAFWQYKPAFGIKLTEIFSDSFTFSNGGISLNIGVEKAFDFKDQKIITNSLSPYFSIKIFYLHAIIIKGECGS